MIVVLMITIIVVGLAFAVLNLVQKQMSGIAQNYEKNTEINLLRQALWIDFQTYSHISYNDKLNILHCENEMRSMTYVFEEELILRETDTFQIKLGNKSFFYDGLQKTSGVIDAIELLTLKEEGDKSIFVSHENAASKYMN